MTYQQWVDSFISARQRVMPDEMDGLRCGNEAPATTMSYDQFRRQMEPGERVEMQDRQLIDAYRRIHQLEARIQQLSKRFEDRQH